MATEAKLWHGQLSSEVEDKIVRVIETVFNLPGNCDEDEILQVAKVLQDFTLNDMDEIDQLNIDIVEVDDDDDTLEAYQVNQDAVDEVLEILTTAQ